MSEPLTVNEVLNEYYKLKSKYETDHYNKYIKPIINAKDKSKREKRLEYQKLPKPECINCKRNVGTVFTTKKEADDESRLFLAKCGDLEDPCPLNIEFIYTNRQELSKELLETDKDINDIKNKIIIDKNNMMFGYTNQENAIKQFNESASELKSITESAGFIMEINIQLNENPVKKDLIKTNEDKFGIEFLLPYKEMIKEYDQTGNTEILNKAVKFYVDEMAPLAKNIRDLKYEVCYVDFLEKKDNDDIDEKGDIYILMQKRNSLNSLEYTLYGNDELKSFTKGVRDEESPSSKSKTKKNLGQIHKKTRKLRPELELVEEGEEGEEGDKKPVNLRKKLVLENATEALEEKEKEEEQVALVVEEDENKVTPYINSDRSVHWGNDEGQTNIVYQRTWDALSPNYKAALTEDEAWMQKTIDYFVAFDKLKKENKVPYTSSREFVHPDGLLLPPVKIEDRKYDYGNAVYNKLLNTGETNIWLSFLPKGNRQSVIDKEFMEKSFPEHYSNEYSGYLNAIASYLGNKLRFTRF